VLLGAPVLLVVGLLLAAADPIFRSWFDLRAIGQHVLLVGVGAWVVAGLARTASAAEPAPALRSPPALGAVEAGVVLGGLSALYAAFAGAQLVALSGAGHRILVTRGLTYARYARSGFFELLACAAVTLLVLLGVRACTSPGHHGLNALAGLTVAFTLVVVVVAIRRLQLYEAAFGLTMLRLACLAVAVWIGIVFLLVAATIPRHGLPVRQLAAALLASVLLLVGGWAACDPAAIVAAVNLHRAETGRPLDLGQAASLGPDATPALVAALPRLSPADQGALVSALCQQWPGPDAGTAFSLSRFRAEQALSRACPGT
jgi:hypothetical protein